MTEKFARMKLDKNPVIHFKYLFFSMLTCIGFHSLFSFL